MLPINRIRVGQAASELANLGRDVRLRPKADAAFRSDPLATPIIMNVSFGSVAVVEIEHSRVAGFGRITDIRPGRMAAISESSH